MTIFHSVILGIVEGLTEFLPVSSTGHLILAGRVLGLGQSDFLKSFEIIIQLGAILAVLVIFWKTFWKIKTLKKIIIGFIPTAIIGFAFYGIVKSVFLDSANIVLWALLLGGLVLIIFEYFYARRKELSPEPAKNEISYKQSFIIGVFQTLAIVPGVSRSAATIIGGLALGISREEIVRFSFLLAVPTILGATGLDILKNYKSILNSDVWPLIVGFIVSFVVAVLAIKFFLRFVRSRNFISFGLYRILIALVFFFIIF